LKQTSTHASSTNAKNRPEHRSQRTWRRLKQLNHDSDPRRRPTSHRPQPGVRQPDQDQPGTDQGGQALVPARVIQKAPQCGQQGTHA
jgi:hypothetical protein